jgi:predicted amidohydrolase
MRVLLGELAPRLGDVAANVGRIEAALDAAPAPLAVFPELFLSGYRAGDRLHGLALRAGDEHMARLTEIARRHRSHLVVGAPVVSTERPGEIYNAVLLIGPDGSVGYQVKRYLPTYGPFEEGRHFTPTGRSRPLALAGRRIGLAICYDTFFPEIFRGLAAEGAELLIVVSASPVTSRALFGKLLPARAIENACPVLYVNRVGVEDGIVFGGGSGAWDVRGEPRPLERTAPSPGEPEEALFRAEVDLEEPGRWRPFRPVLRDVTARPGDLSTALPGPRPEGPEGEN